MSGILTITNRSKVSLRRLFKSVLDAQISQVNRKRRVLPRSWKITFTFILVGLFILYIMMNLDVLLLREADEIARGSSNVRLFFQLLTKLGSSAWILIGTALFGLLLSMRDWRVTNRISFGSIRKNFGLYSDANFIFFTVASSGILVSIIKNTIGRARPKHLEDFGHLYFDFAAFTSDFASFPSGHSTTFGAFCFALALLYPRYKWVLLFLALLGGASRVMVSAHYPSDVLTGLLFGAGFVWLSARYLARRNLMFRFRDGLVPQRKR